MIVVVLSEDQSVARAVQDELTRNNIVPLCFRDPLRLIDVLADLRPEAIILRQKDFPVHEQVIEGFLRFYPPLHHCALISIGRDQEQTEGYFSIDEAQFLRDPSILSHISLTQHY